LTLLLHFSLSLARVVSLAVAAGTTFFGRVDIYEYNPTASRIAVARNEP
jgi:hypothetical protein